MMNENFTFSSHQQVQQATAMNTKSSSSIDGTDRQEHHIDSSILRSATIVVKGPQEKVWRDVLTSFLKSDDRHLAGSYDSEAILKAIDDAFSELAGHVLGTTDHIVISAASDFRCLLLAVVTGKRILDVDVFGNPCLSFQLIHQGSPKAVMPNQVQTAPNFLTAAPSPTILQWSSIGKFDDVVADINTYLENSLGNLDKVNTTTAKITTIAKRTNSLFEKTSKLLSKLQLVLVNRQLPDKTTGMRSTEGPAKRAATAAPTMRTATGKELCPEPLTKMAKKDTGDVHMQKK